MKWNKYTILISLLICSNLIFAKKNITIVVLKGKATIEAQQTKNYVLRTQKAEIPLNAMVKLVPNSSIIIYDTKSKLDLVNSLDISYTYNQLNVMLSKVKPGSLSSSFIDYLDKMYISIEKNNNSFGATIGAVSRGTESENLSFYPPDEIVILNDSFELIIGDSNTILKSNITITNDSSQSMISIDAIKNKANIKNLKPGHYTWKYQLKSLEGLLLMENTFVVPDTKLKVDKLKMVNDFIFKLNECKDCLNQLTKEILLEDFLAVNNLYYNPK